MKSYIDIVKKVIKKGVLCENRTSEKSYVLIGDIIEHDMQKGFPLVTTKKMPFSVIAAELEFFIKGLTSKKWLQDRNCHIWDEWCNPEKVKHISNKHDIIKKMAEEDDLGPIYGKQWREFSSASTDGIDQFSKLLDELSKNPDSRRHIVTAWNPFQLDKMALPPCHVLFQVHIVKNMLSLTWFQRSCDLMLGIPFNIASYGLLLHLLAKQFGYIEGKLVGHLSNVHIYENHIMEAQKQINRQPFKLPSIQTDNFVDVFKWKYTDTKLKNYNSHPKIKFDVSI